MSENLVEFRGMQMLSANGYKPAKGLHRLTWTQVEQIDAAISSLCALTEQDRGEIHLTIVIRNGKPRGMGWPVPIEKLAPTRK